MLPGYVMGGIVVKSVKAAVKYMIFLITVTVIFIFLPATEMKAAEDVPVDSIYNVVPRMEWTLSKNQSGLHAFTFGEGIHEFCFSPVNIEWMQYLEFDIYLSDINVVTVWQV